MKRRLVAAFVLALAATPASAELIRSDLPLWGHGDAPEAIWPQHFSTDDGGFGCTSRLRFGDWRLVTRDDDREDVQWMRIHNYGVFHCAAGFRRAYGRSGLPDAVVAFGYLVDLGDVRTAAGTETLHALQMGLIGGSEYLLLAAAPAPPGDPPRSYRVLEAECPASARRNGPAVDVWRTSYCAVKDRRTLIAMARRAAQKASLTRLELVGDFDPPDAD